MSGDVPPQRKASTSGPFMPTHAGSFTDVLYACAIFLWFSSRSFAFPLQFSHIFSNSVLDSSSASWISPPMFAAFSWLWNILSVSRQAFPPSIFTSKEYRIQVASFMFVLDFTPPAVPASSPLLRLNSDPLMAIMFPPSASPVLLPLARSLDLAMFGYGSGTGPPGDGVLQTSGIVAVDMPPLPLWTRLFDDPLTLTVTDMTNVRLTSAR